VPADLALIAETWEALRPRLAEEHCPGCECLQGALTELRLSLEELPGSADRDALLARITGARERSLHGCLDCRPCPPADILVAFYREQARREAAGCCGSGAT